MADYSDLPFDVGDIDYTVQCQTLTSRNEGTTTEVEDSRQGESTLGTLTGNLKTEVEAAREGETNLVTNLQTNYLASGSQSVDVDINNQRIVNAAAGTLPLDSVRLTELQAIEAAGAGGIDQSVIIATQLDNGTGTTGQRYVVNAGNVVGEANTILTTDVAGLTARQMVGADNTPTLMEVKDLTNISSGAMTSGERVTAKAAGPGLETYDGNLEESSSASYF